MPESSSPSSSSWATTSPGTDLSAAGRGRRLRAPALTVGALAAATIALRLHDPHQRGSWGVCPSALLGLSCPGCGGLRAVNDLTHGDVAAAASSNLLLVVGAPFLLAWLGAWTIARWRGRPMPRLPAAAGRLLLWLAALGGLAFTVLRNTPTGAWLAP